MADRDCARVGASPEITRAVAVCPQRTRQTRQAATNPVFPSMVSQSLPQTADPAGFSPGPSTTKPGPLLTSPAPLTSAGLAARAQHSRHFSGGPVCQMPLLEPLRGTTHLCLRLSLLLVACHAEGHATPLLSAASDDAYGDDAWHPISSSAWALDTPFILYTHVDHHLNVASGQWQVGLLPYAAGKGLHSFPCLWTSRKTPNTHNTTQAHRTHKTVIAERSKIAGVTCTQGLVHFTSLLSHAA